MRKIMTMVLVLAIAALSAKAQESKPAPPKKTPEERAENMTRRMTKELALSPEQQTKVKAAILKRETMREQKMEAAKTEMDKIDAEFKQILSQDQYVKFQQKREEMKKKRKEGKEGKPDREGPPDEGPPPPAPPTQK